MSNRPLIPLCQRSDEELDWQIPTMFEYAAQAYQVKQDEEAYNLIHRALEHMAEEAARFMADQAGLEGDHRERYCAKAFALLRHDLVERSQIWFASDGVVILPPMSNGHTKVLYYRSKRARRMVQRHRPEGGARIVHASTGIGSSPGRSATPPTFGPTRPALVQGEARGGWRSVRPGWRSFPWPPN